MNDFWKRYQCKQPSQSLLRKSSILRKCKLMIAKTNIQQQYEKCWQLYWKLFNLEHLIWNFTATLNETFLFETLQQPYLKLFDLKYCGSLNWNFLIRNSVVTLFETSKSSKFPKVSNSTSHSKSRLKVSNKQTRLETRCAIKIWNFSQLCIKPTGFLVMLENISNEKPSANVMVISSRLEISYFL